MNSQHTYRIRHNGIESTPHSLAELRQMWKSGAIDSTTEFKRGESSVWLDANDLWTELRLEEASPAAKASIGGLSPQIGPARPGSSREIAPTAPVPVSVVSMRLPFREVFALVAKLFAAAILLAIFAAAAWLAAGKLLR